MSEEKASVDAFWSLSLNCDCPSCGEFVDLLEDGDFWESHQRLQPIEYGTERANNLEVSCPKCGREFIICCNY